MNTQQSQSGEPSREFSSDSSEALAAGALAAGELSWLAFRFVAGELSGDELAAFEQRLEVDQGAREAVAEMVELTTAVQCVASTDVTYAVESRRDSDSRMAPTPAAPFSAASMPAAPAPTVSSPTVSSPNVATLAAPPSSPLAAARWWSPAMWMSAGAAVCLLAITARQVDWSWVGSGWIGGGSSSSEVAMDDSGDSAAPRQLALVWSQTRQETSELTGVAQQDADGDVDSSETEADDMNSSSDDMLGDLATESGSSGVGEPVSEDGVGARRMPSWMMAAVSVESGAAKPAPKPQVSAAPQSPQGL